MTRDFTVRVAGLTCGASRCPLLAGKRTSQCISSMSAFGGKADIIAGNPMSAFDPKRTFNMLIIAQLTAIRPVRNLTTSKR